jgi:Aspartyl-tRNA synthetase
MQPAILKHLLDSVVKRNLKIRHQIKQSASTYLCNNGFLEIDTPVLGPLIEEYTKDNFCVIADNGVEYALPQSPQIYKQIIMIAGYEKYFQFAHCFRRDPDTNLSNHHANEFMQIDIEMQTDSLNDVMNTAEELICKILNDLNVTCQSPFQIIDGNECKLRYGTDKPDLRQYRNDYSFIWIRNLPLIESVKDFDRIKVTSSELKSNDKIYIPSHHIFAKPDHLPYSLEYTELQKVTTQSFDLVLNGVEICSGDLRITDRVTQERIMEIFHIDKHKYKFYLDLLKNASSNGGFAIGLDRLTMLLSGSENIHYSNAFYESWWK